jgi:hypothetical protein
MAGKQRLKIALPPTLRKSTTLKTAFDVRVITIDITTWAPDSVPMPYILRLESVTASRSVSPDTNATPYTPALPAMSAT